jgi:hypothetical protein
MSSSEQVMLSAPGDFDGGTFRTLEVDGSFMEYEFEQVAEEAGHGCTHGARTAHYSLLTPPAPPCC